MVEKLLADQEDLGLGVVDDVLHLGRSEAPVHRYAHRVELRSSKEIGEVLGAVLVEISKAIPSPDSVRCKRVCDPIRFAIELCEGPGPVFEAKCNLVRLVPSVLPGDVGQGLNRHGYLQANDRRERSAPSRPFRIVRDLNLG